MAGSVSRFNRGNYELEANTEHEEKRYKQLRYDLAQRQANLRRDLAGYAQDAKEIRDKRLYKAHYPSFDQFCRIELGYAKQHVERLIRCAEAIPVIGTIGSKIPNEGVLREYIAIAEKQPERAKVVYQAVSTSRANATAVEHHKAVKAVTQLPKSASEAQVKKAVIEAVTPSATKTNGARKPPTAAQRSAVDDLVHAINRIASSTHVALDDFLAELSPAQRASFLSAAQVAATYLAFVVRAGT